MAELSSAIGRLEQVTERLLKLEVSLGGTALSSNGMTSAAPAASTAAAPAASNASSATVAGSAALSDYDRLLSEHLAKVMQQAAAIGGEVLEASKLVDKALQEQRKVIIIASKAKQPGMDQLQTLLQPVAQPMMAASSLAENRRSPVFQQLKVVAEGLQGLSWLAYTGPSCGLHTPFQHIGECWNSAEFFANKLLKELRGVDESTVTWVKALKDTFSGLQSFVGTHFASGLKWSPAGVSLEDAIKDAAGAAPTAVPAATAPQAAKVKPPPAAPPPPPPREVLEQMADQKAAAAAAATVGGGGGMASVLKAIQQGGGVTSGLRKVTDDMKSKNQADRTGHVAGPPRTAGTAAAAPANGSATTTAAVTSSGPPRFELERERKWVIENQGEGKELVVKVASPKHSVYIFNCHGCVVQVRGKCNAISIDKSRKVGVVFEDVIASCELVNCTGVQVQCTGAVPTMSVDKCDGVQMYIPAALAANPDFQVVTAKSSEVNVMVTPADPDTEDVAEHAVPEQFISSFKEGKLVTTAACHGGG